MKDVLIVESPGKVKKIAGFLQGKMIVAASVGHVRDLPGKDMGINHDTLELSYEPTDRGKAVLSRLKPLVKNAKNVFLATDPDREGEAIAWHLADALQLKNPKRITFTAITEEKVKRALEKPRLIDMKMVRAQEARRALDRIVGWSVSPALSRHMDQMVSGGRVQSPALRIVADRERAICSFVKTEHFGVELLFRDRNGCEWRAVWDVAQSIPKSETYCLDRNLAIEISQSRHLIVRNVKKTTNRLAPSPPFITSTLQQIASSKLKWSPKKTMEVAQSLYENGKITYHRTDNPNIDPEGIRSINAFLKENGHGIFEGNRKWKVKDGAQEGHEAIRPSHIEVRELNNGVDEDALYKLIWSRSIASQMQDSLSELEVVTLESNDRTPKATFLASHKKLIFEGWREFYRDDYLEESEADRDAEKGGINDNVLPQMSEGQNLEAVAGEIVVKTTKAPKRYSEASLISELERLGIGRPSTYAAILGNIVSRGYITINNKRQLCISPLGESIVSALMGRFHFIQLEYTGELEGSLDEILNGSTTFEVVVRNFWDEIEKELQEVGWEKPQLVSEHRCSKCGKGLVHKIGTSKATRKKYDFYGCSGFPSCRETYRTGLDGLPILGSIKAK